MYLDYKVKNLRKSWIPSAPMTPRIKPGSHRELIFQEVHIITYTKNLTYHTIKVLRFSFYALLFIQITQYLNIFSKTLSSALLHDVAYIH